MIPISLKLSNFTSYGEKVPELDFTKFHLAVISGSNGVGKSSLLDAITWCVWGWSRAGDSSDQLVRLGTEQMWVEFGFKLDENQYIVKRKRFLSKGGSTALELWSGAHNLTEGTIKATQQKIINLLHLGIETFTNSSFLRQGHADEFTTKGATDRKRILADILGLDHYDLLEEKAKTKVKDIHTKLQLLEYQLLEIDAELSQKEDRETKRKVAEELLVKLEKEINQLETDLKILREKHEGFKIINEQKIKLSENLQSNIKELEDIKNQGILRKQRIDKLKLEVENLSKTSIELTQLNKLQKEKGDMEKIREKRLNLEKDLTEIKGKLELKKQRWEQFNTKISETSSKLQDLKKEGAKCPTCGQEIGKTHKEKVNKELLGEIELLQKEVQKIDLKEETKLEENLIKELENLKFDNNQYLDIIKQLNNLESLQKQKEELIGKQATLQTEQRAVEELRSLYQNKKTQVEKAEKEYSQLPDINNKLSEVTLMISQNEDQLTNFRQEEKVAQSSLGQITELISRTAQTEKLKRQKQSENENLQKEKQIYEELSLAFGKKGIQAMIIETAIPEIEDEANRLLDKLSQGRMRVRFETQKETKTKGEDGERGIVETLEIIISDEMGEREYSLYSGGEAFRINFAIRLALSKLLTRRAGAKLQFLVIDEGFGTQDEEGRTKIVEVLDIIKNDFEKILVITHLDELKEEFPVRIEVNKGTTGSTFQLIG